MLAVAPGPASADLPSSYTWGTSFSGSEMTGFLGSYYANHGECSVSVAGGAAMYAWRSSASDGASTRCYPVVVWDDKFSGFRATGRFWADLDRGQLSSNRTFSLGTFKLAPNDWDRPLTLNLVVKSSGPTAGRASLMLYHTPSHGSGTQTRVREVEFPLKTWVTVTVTMTSGGDIEVFQNGQLVIKARKTDAPGHLWGAHWGGYANAALTGWTVGNDDLDVRGLGAPPPAIPDAAPAPAPPPAALVAPAPATAPGRRSAPKGALKMGARLSARRVTVGVSILPEHTGDARVQLVRVATGGKGSRNRRAAAGRRLAVTAGKVARLRLSVPARRDVRIVPLRLVVRLDGPGAARTTTRSFAVMNRRGTTRVVQLARPRVSVSVTS